MAYPDLSNYQGTVDPAAFRARLEQAGVPVAGATSAGGVSYGMQAPATYTPQNTQPVVVQHQRPVQTVQPTQPIQQQPAQVNVDAQNYINKLIDMQKQARFADLAKSRDSALSNLNQEKATIQPMYYDKRNQVAAGAQQQARNFAEYMASRGGATSGTAAQATLMNNVATQGNLGGLRRQEAQDLAGIAQRTTDVNNAFTQDVTSANAGIEGDRLNLLLQDLYKAQARGDTQAQQAIQNALQTAQLTGNLNGERTVQGQQLDNNNAIAKANLTGQYQDPQTALAIQQMQRNSAAWFNATPEEQARLADQNQQLGASIGATQDANGNWVFPQGQQTLQAQAAELQRQQVQQQLKSGDINNATAQFKLDQLQDPNSPVNQAAQLDLQIKQLQAQFLPQQQKLQLQQLQKQIAQIGAAPYQSEMDKQLDQVKLDTAKQQLELLKNSQPKSNTGNFNLDDYKGFISQNFYKDVPANPSNSFDKTTKKVFDKTAAYNYILGLNLPNDSDTDQLLKLFQLPTK